MAFLIGTDEAGYGPNLGPLVVSASLWQLPDEALNIDLYKLLASVVSASPDSSEANQKTVLADSKLLYKPGARIAGLERGVLAMIETTGQSPRTWRESFRTLDPGSCEAMDRLPWYAEYDDKIPRECEIDHIKQLCETFRSGCAKAGVECLAIRSRIVFPQQLNELIQKRGNKATSLSTVTLSLIQSLVEPLPKGRLLVHCDKHGGRNKYASLLQRFFPEFLVEVCRESRMESIYRWGPADRRIEFRFAAKGESCMASALSSMTSKYLRELAMEAFNQFWCSRVPGLRPTAGYPVDAKRFKSEIQKTQREIKIPDRILWRNR